ncbi:MAG: thermonuclease family protein [Bacteroidia bacterium]|nr:thermonuclease family protein [Bacteroidia bacterium]MDW8332863.1 thermonuclease family protein [Bacteroidia bacterium]
MLKKSSRRAAIAAALILTACQFEGNRPASMSAAPYLVVGVSDGDTFNLLEESTKANVKVRLYGVDAPEKKQAFGERAKQFASELCYRKRVRLEEVSKDRYGRSVAYMYLEDGTNVNYELIRSGMAWHYKQFSKDAELERLEKEARKKRLGLWRDPNPTPPWEWRKKRRES